MQKNNSDRFLARKVTARLRDLLTKGLKSIARHPALTLIIAVMAGIHLVSYYHRPDMPKPEKPKPERPWNFDDNQPLHIDAAEKLGIAPVQNRAAVDSLPDSLVHIVTCDDYEVAGLSHSVPYLTPGAATLLADLGRAFRDSLRKDSLREHRILVTSVLRTRKDVERLQRHNANATTHSAHLYATTFDVSYRRFGSIGDTGRQPADSVLEATLSHVLRDLHARGRCYVKRENRQPCFHITTRK